MKQHNCLNIDRIAFIGRTFDEYMSIFALNETTLRQGNILDCPAGASSFTAEAAERGIDATACDIAYNHTAEQLAAKGDEDINHVFDKFDEVSHLYTWTYYRNKDDVIACRKSSLDSFIRDFPSGCREGRYRYCRLPHLPFPDRHFSLVLSSHFLFLYGDRLGYDFHIACLKELVRVCSGEVRLYPLTGLDAKLSAHLDAVLMLLNTSRADARVVKINFEFQKGSNRMLRIKIK